MLVDIDKLKSMDYNGLNFLCTVHTTHHPETQKATGLTFKFTINATMSGRSLKIKESVLGALKDHRIKLDKVCFCQS